MAAFEVEEGELAPLAQKLGVSVGNLKHISAHWGEFQELAPEITLEDVVEIGKDVRQFGTQVSPNAWEEAVKIGGNDVVVKAVVNPDGNLRTVFVKH